MVESVVCPGVHGVSWLESPCCSRRERSTGWRGHPPEFRRRVLDPVEFGRSVAEVAWDLQIGQQPSTCGAGSARSTVASSRGRPERVSVARSVTTPAERGLDRAIGGQIGRGASPANRGQTRGGDPPRPEVHGLPGSSQRVAQVCMAVKTGVNRTGFVGDSVHWFPTPAGSACRAA